MSKIPTAEEFLNDIDEIARNYDRYEYGLPTGNYDLNLEMQSKIIEFAKLHVKEALKEAEKETVKHISKTILELNMYNKNSILNAYPLENIK